MYKLISMLKWSPLLLIVALLISCAGPTTTNITTVQFESDGTTCKPNSFNTQQGFLVKLTLKNTGTTEVVFNYPDGPYSFKAAPGQTALGNFTAPTSTGNYDFQCGQTQGKMSVKNS